ncbi:phosphoethanolamine transferase [Methylomicrobium lacus]|uniref:phosphoethanolamine transferase n=1 Tax=Methylomicrobium lacus TaxID=136992 RepID=UPI0035A9AC7D
MENLKRLTVPCPALTNSLFLILFCNTALWHELFKIKGGLSLDTLLFYAPFFLVLTLLLKLFFTLFRLKYLFKGVLVVFLFASAAIDYFMVNYGVVIDKSMLQNALETNSGEAFELLNWQMLGYLIVLGGIPAALIVRTKITYQPLPRQLLKNLGALVVCAALIGGLSYVFYGDYTSIYRNHRELRYLINPVNLVDSSVSNLKRKLKGQHALIPLGADAKMAAAPNPSGKKNLTVLVLGETARAANFALDGYPRPTDPYLSQQQVLSFTNVHSCGTATAASVPCMFSNFGQDHYDPAKAQYTENVLDVLSHAGVKVLWRNNNDGCKGVCKRVASEDISHLKLANLCNAEDCYDEALLYQLQAYVDKLTSHGVIVLHQKGSHGPGYNLRHPAKFTVFKPECEQDNLNDCSHQEVVNAYDNTIAYTDYFLAKVIDFLKKNSAKYDTAMLYVSDHGESLGENNVYLHGLPYFIAPDEQKHVPLITWFSQDFIHDHKIDSACLRQHKDNPYSHDNLFHSLLGLMDVHTQVYDAKLDIFATCRA